MVNTSLTTRSSRSMLSIWELECTSRLHTNRSPMASRNVWLICPKCSPSAFWSLVHLLAYWNFAITHAADLLRHRA
eukprot:730153-Amphidinium_carterae.3